MTTTSSGQRMRSFSSDGRSARSARLPRRTTTVRPGRSRSSARRTSRRRSPSSGRASRKKSASTGRTSRRRRRRSTRRCTPTTSTARSAPRTRRTRRARAAASTTPTPRAFRSCSRSRRRPRAASRATSSPATDTGTDTDGAPPLPQRHHLRSKRSSCPPSGCLRVRLHPLSFRESAGGLRLRWRTSHRRPSLRL